MLQGCVDCSSGLRLPSWPGVATYINNMGGKEACSRGIGNQLTQPIRAMDHFATVVNALCQG